MEQQTNAQNKEGTQLPSQARVVIIGGGAVGCSIAWHLGQAGWHDTVLLKKMN